MLRKPFRRRERILIRQVQQQVAVDERELRRQRQRMTNLHTDFLGRIRHFFKLGDDGRNGG